MENYLLGIFKDHLSELIVGFRREQVNANLLNGKGSITDVSLNVAVLNKTLSAYLPYIELESVHVNSLSINVTSFTNIKKAPIEISIDEVTARIVEPMEFERAASRKFVIYDTKGREPRGPYNLFDRIGDNITIDINRVYLTFQPMGKFKTRRVGPWTPPALSVTMKNLRYVSVDESGEEGTPEAVWHHNSRAQRKERDASLRQSVFIYKKLGLNCTVSLIPTSVKDCKPRPLVRDALMEVHIAFHKRLSDAALLAIQTDVTLSTVEIEVDDKAVPLLAHAAKGMQFCLCRDRNFEDPLLEKDESKRKGRQSKEANESIEVSLDESIDTSGPVGKEGTEKCPNEISKVFLTPGVSFISEGSETEGSTSAIAEAGTVATIAKLPEEELFDDNEDEDSAKTDATPPENLEGAEVRKSQQPQQQQLAETKAAQTPPGHPILVLPGDILIHQKFSFSMSIHECTIRAKYHANTNGYMQLVLKGTIAELIWPKIMGDVGGYCQLSLSYVSIQERHGKTMRPLLSGGNRQKPDWLAPIGVSEFPSPEVDCDSNFPLFEFRSIREDPLGLRHTFPSQAFGLKTTVDFVGERKARPIKEQKLQVLHEVGIDKFEIVMDADAWCRALRYVANEDEGGFDERWSTGDWSDALTTDMMVRPEETLNLDEHLQEMPEIFLDENSMVSSELFNVTARITNVELRMPAPVHLDVRSSDITVTLDETMLIVSSALPRSFLTGKVGAFGEDSSIDKAAVDFPNDPSDMCYSLPGDGGPSPVAAAGGSDDDALPSPISTFRVQVTLRGFSIRTVPLIPFRHALEPQSLVAPTEVTLIGAFEGEVSPESNLIKMGFYLSILVSRMDVNVDLEVLASALGTARHHVQLVDESFAFLAKARGNNKKTAESDRSDASAAVPKAQSGELSNSNGKVKHRRALVRKQMTRSREAGGLTLVLRLHIPDFEFRLWRQNVPLRVRNDASDATPGEDCHSEALLLLSKVTFRNLEFGAEAFEGGFDGKEDCRDGDDAAEASRRTRRIVVKGRLSEFGIKICDFDAVCDADRRAVKMIPAMTGSDDKGAADEKTADEKGSATADVDFSTSVALMAIGTERTIGGCADKEREEDDISFRVEQRLGESDDTSCSVDVSAGATVQLSLDKVEAVANLIVEALLMPTGRACHTSPFRDCKPDDDDDDSDRSAGSSYHNSGAFPVGSVGAFLASLISERPIAAAESVGSTGTGQFGTKLNHTKSLRLASRTMDLALFRICLRDLLLVIPCQETKGPPYFGLILAESSITTGYFDKSHDDGVFEVLAGRGKGWGTFFLDQEAGFHHILESKQSLFHLPDFSTDEGGKECQVNGAALVPSFSASCYYHPGSVNASIGDCSVSFDSIDLMMKFYNSLVSCAARCTSLASNLSFMFSTVGNHGRVSGKEMNAGDDHLRCAFDDASVSIKAARSLLNRIKESLSSHDWELRSTLSAKQAEVDCLRSSVFSKERQRIAALSLLSSQTSGWLRMGRTHLSGERISSTATLLRYWGVLRKSLLIIYTAPGTTKPFDIIPLQGAKLRALAGEKRKSILNRGFALVESKGKTRFFIAGSNVEYESWIKALLDAIDTYSSLESSDSSDTVGQDTHLEEEKLLDDAETVDEPTIAILDNSDAVGSHADTELPDTAKALLEDLAEEAAPIPNILDVSHGDSADEDPTPSPSTKPEGPYPVAESEQGTDGSAQQQQEIQTQPSKIEISHDAVSEEHPGESAQRGQQIRQRLSVMKASTRTKLGSAVKSAKENVMHASDRSAAGSPTRPTPKGPNILSSDLAKGEVNPTSGNSKELVPSQPANLEHQESPVLPVAKRITFRDKMTAMKSKPTVSKFSAAMKSVGGRSLQHAVEPQPGTRGGGEVSDKNAEVSEIADTATSEHFSEKTDSQNSSGQSIPSNGQPEAASSTTHLNAWKDESGHHDENHPQRGQQLRNKVSSKFGAAVKQAKLNSEALKKLNTSTFQQPKSQRAHTVGIEDGPQSTPTRPKPKSMFDRTFGTTLTGQQSTGNVSKEGALKLKSVRVDSGLPSAKRMNDNKSHVTQEESAKIKGGWVVHVTAEMEENKSKKDMVNGVPQDGIASSSEQNEIGSSSQADECEEKFQTAGKDVAHIEKSEIHTGAKLKHENLGVYVTPNDMNRPLQRVFRVHTMCTNWHKENDKPHIDDVTKTLSDVLALHTVVSEAISKISDPKTTAVSDDKIQKDEVGLSELGLLPVEQVRLTGKLLGGLLDSASEVHEARPVREYQCEILAEFLNSTLASPLPTLARVALSHFLGLDSIMEGIESNERSSSETAEAHCLVEKTPSTTSASCKILSLSAACESELVRAESRGLVAKKLASTISSAPSVQETAPQGIHHPVVPPSISDSLHAAMHAALMTAMEERDEAHAQLIATSVFHVHEMEQERKKVEHLTKQLEVAENLANTGGTSFFAGQDELSSKEKLRKYEKQMMQNSDAELLALCNQLSSEIAGRTSAALEIIRMKEIRKIERDAEMAQRQALQDELDECKKMLEKEKRKSYLAREDARAWRQSFSEIVDNNVADTEKS